MVSLGPIGAVRVSAPRTASAVVIFFHGLGDKGDGWSFLPAEMYRRPSLQHINFVLPNAPVRDITAFGQPSPAWFDVTSFNNAGPVDERGIQQSLATVRELVDKEIARGIPPERIVIGGFSQGCALTEGAAITLQKKVAGFLCVSGFVPIPRVLEKTKLANNLETPLLMLHGTADQIVPYKLGVYSRNQLRNEFGFKNVEWHDYEGLAHNLNEEGLTEIADFLQRTLPAT